MLFQIVENDLECLEIAQIADFFAALEGYAGSFGNQLFVEFYAFHLIITDDIQRVCPSSFISEGDVESKVSVNDLFEIYHADIISSRRHVFEVHRSIGIIADSELCL